MADLKKWKCRLFFISSMNHHLDISYRKEGFAHLLNAAYKSDIANDMADTVGITVIESRVFRVFERRVFFQRRAHWIRRFPSRFQRVERMKARSTSATAADLSSEELFLVWCSLAPPAGLQRSIGQSASSINLYNYPNDSILIYGIQSHRTPWFVEI